MSRILVLVTLVATMFLTGAESLRTEQDATKDIMAALQQDVHNHWNFLHPQSGTMLGDANGGGGCAACTLIIGLLEQVAQLKNETIDKTIGNFCGHIDPHIAKGCTDFFNEYGAAIIKLIESDFTGDEVCNSIGICKDTDGKKCRLFPPSHFKLDLKAITREIQMKKIKAEVQAMLPQVTLNNHGVRAFNICTILPGICPVENHLPQTDVDGDRFSPKGAKRMRGTYWRGIDCDDTNAAMHPGAASLDAGGDENCNGIFGIDSATGKTYEEKFCEGTGARGTAILGDSATAHFAIPPQWLTARDVAKTGFKTFDHLLRFAEDEMDWPMLSWSTGHLNTTDFAPDVTGPVDSVYLRSRENNLCNNQDYQNLGVNGARVSKLKPFAELLGRVSSVTPAKNKPLQLWMAMIGNDVCNGHHTFRTMTPVDQFKASVKEAVMYADTILAPNSSIVLMGLAHGTVLWDTMHARIHPIGSTNNDVTYEDVYDYLNCLHLNPCWGWLNSNRTVREMTEAHALALSATLHEIVTETQPLLQHVKIVAITDWADAITQAPEPHWKLIEPVDGFHPSQLGNALIAKWMNNKTKSLGLAPMVNPNNAAIKMKFNL